MSKLFTPAQVGPYRLSHRVVMAPLTRMRSDPGDIPSDLMVKYYTQRASDGGLIVSEATPVSIRGNGYAGAQGIYSDTQIAGWRRVTDAVHAKGGRIFQQLWHVGRQSHVDLQPNGEAPVAPSAIPAQGYAYTKRGEEPFSMPRVLELPEIPAIIEEFRSGAERAQRAGFRRRRDSRREWLPTRSIPAGRHQQARGRIRRLDLCLGCRSCGRAHLAERLIWINVG
jgi:N-ethylmaleimide reductase